MEIFIWQRRFDIKRDAKAYEGFHHIKGKKQIRSGGIRDAFLQGSTNGWHLHSTSQPVETLYRLLKAMDYGKGNSWASPKMKTVDGKVTDVKAYRLVKHDSSEDMLTEKGI